MRYLKFKNPFIRNLPVWPVIYPAALFIILLDIWVEIYHRVAFPVYGLSYLKRKDYIVIDRHKLKYLTVGQKINCVYCGYANGVLQYIVRIVGETERYWCGIQHKQKEGFNAPAHHEGFVAYGDEDQFKRAYVTGQY